MGLQIFQRSRPRTFTELPDDLKESAFKTDPLTLLRDQAKLSSVRYAQPASTSSAKLELTTGMRRERDTVVLGKNVTGVAVEGENSLKNDNSRTSTGYEPITALSSSNQSNQHVPIVWNTIDQSTTTRSGKSLVASSGSSGQISTTNIDETTLRNTSHCSAIKHVPGCSSPFSCVPTTHAPLITNFNTNTAPTAISTSFNPVHASATSAPKLLPFSSITASTPSALKLASFTSTEPSAIASTAFESLSVSQSLGSNNVNSSKLLGTAFNDSSDAVITVTEGFTEKGLDGISTKFFPDILLQFPILEYSADELRLADYKKGRRFHFQ